MPRLIKVGPHYVSSESIKKVMFVPRVARDSRARIDVILDDGDEVATFYKDDEAAEMAAADIAEQVNNPGGA